MANSAFVSPFAVIDQDEAWVLWRAKQPISELEASSNTDGRFVSEDDRCESLPIHTSLSQKQQISRPQYNAVLHRIQQASKNVSNFSAWSN